MTQAQQAEMAGYERELRRLRRLIDTPDEPANLGEQIQAVKKQYLRLRALEVSERPAKHWMYAAE